jgi:hypothetical protein
MQEKPNVLLLADIYVTVYKETKPVYNRYCSIRVWACEKVSDKVFLFFFFLPRGSTTYTHTINFHFPIYL